MAFYTLTIGYVAHKSVLTVYNSICLNIIQLQFEMK